MLSANEDMCCQAERYVKNTAFMFIAKFYFYSGLFSVMNFVVVYNEQHKSSFRVQFFSTDRKDV